MKNGLELGAVITWPQCVEIEKNQTEAQLATVAVAAAAVAAATESGKQVGKNVASAARKESSENTLRNATLS